MNYLIGWLKNSLSAFNRKASTLLRHPHKATIKDEFSIAYIYEVVVGATLVSAVSPECEYTRIPYLSC